MPRIVRLSVLAVCSMALLSLSLAGCGGQPTDGTHVQANEVERKQAIDKMRSVMDARKTFKPGRGLH